MYLIGGTFLLIAEEVTSRFIYEDGSFVRKLRKLGFEF